MNTWQQLNIGVRFIYVVVYFALAVCVLTDDLSRASPAEEKVKRAVTSNQQQTGKARETRSRQPAATQCCACGKAYYKVTFIATWKRASHPKHFPGLMARWSPMLGCSHNNKYILWRYGSMASVALRRFSELGDTSLLQDEMTQQLDKNVLNIIKTSAIWSGKGKSSARFAVDHKHNLVSVVARVTPSPDWNVGIDSLNLCTVNCTWVNYHTVDLHVWDGGTDDGINFVSVNKRTSPQQPIQRINNRLHWHPKSSLYKRKGETRRPFGQLRIELRHISGNCGARPRPPSPPRPPRRDCVVTKWSSWTKCFCGRGKAARFRGRVVTTQPSKDGLPCPRLRETKKCRCLRLSNKNSASRDCKVGRWSSWSACTTKCSGGKRIKTRVIIQQPDVGGRRCPQLIKKKNCGRQDKCKAVNTVTKDCVVSEWTRWSPCSKACNRGKRVRTRIVKEAQQNGGKRCPKLYEKQKCVAHSCGIKR